MSYDDLSSPDPLATSPSTDTFFKPSSQCKTTPAPLRKHKTSRTSLESVSILPHLSPSRTVTEQALSPWKIRVTVEAEPEEYSYGLVETTTRTTKVPLRGENLLAQNISDKSSRSQPRSRAGSASKGRQRSVTPVAERRRRQSVTDLDITVLGDDSEGDEWGKGPKKISHRKARVKKDTSKQTANVAQHLRVSDFEVRQDTDVDEESHVTMRDESPELRQIDLNRVSVRARANSVKEQPPSNEQTTCLDNGHQNLKPLPSTATTGRRTVSANSAMTYPTPSPTVSERGQSVDIEEEGEQGRDHPEGFDTIMESEGFTMIDLESIPSVKQMLSSPLENQVAQLSSESKSPAESDSTVRRNKSFGQPYHNELQIQPLRAIPPHLVLPDGESEISSTVPSSPPTFLSRPQITRQKTPISHLQVPAQPRNRQVTPQPYSSPKLPSPPRQITPKDRSTPDSAKALKAGLALQNAIEPVRLLSVGVTQQKTTPVATTHGRSSSDEVLFEGYDSGTQRELRAGLRFGEELAKRQHSSMQYSNHEIQPIDNLPSRVWRGESVISRTPVPVQSSLDQTNNSRLTLRPSNGPSTTSTPRAQAVTDDQYLDTDLRREKEWQLEREAVSKQIEEASPSKVIVIDSDDEEEDTQQSSESLSQNESMQDFTTDDGGDIWLEEAKDSSSSPRQDREETELDRTSEQPRDDRRSRDTVEVPRRSLIPSPWKRGEQLEQGNNSTFMTSGDEFSGILWRQPQGDEIRFGDIAINNARRQLKNSEETEFVAKRTSGLFDIEKMLGTPKRMTLSDELEESQKQSDQASRHVSNVLAEESTQQDGVEDEVVSDDASLESMHSDGTSVISDQHHQTVLVNFNDSTASQMQATPPRTDRPRTSYSPLQGKQQTPRSAMKGTRQSFGAALETSDQAARKVIFAQRSRGVNVNWVESSSSVHLSTDDSISSPIIDHQRHHQERQSVHVSSPEPQEVVQTTPPVQQTVPQSENQNPEQNQKGWLGWLWKDKKDHKSSTTTSQVDGTIEPSQPQLQPEIEPDTDWIKTSRHSAPTQQLQSRPPKSLSLPSYLLPPSYPSDPTRSPTTPLGSTGSFSNTHFRTLHILHRKSQRPRFHAPPFSECRPDLRDLVAKKWDLEIDESDAGLGEFAWTLGEVEARLLERFCREVEFSVLSPRGEANERMLQHWFDADIGIWGGHIQHGTADVRWEWNVEQLATWLGRIVVGEVVRLEEFGAKVQK